MRITVAGGMLTQPRLALFRRFKSRLRRRGYLQPQVPQKATLQANLTKENYSGSGADNDSTDPADQKRGRNVFSIVDLTGALRSGQLRKMVKHQVPEHEIGADFRWNVSWALEGARPLGDPVPY